MNKLKTPFFMFLIGSSKKQACSATCSQILSDQHLFGRWTPNVESVGGAARLYEPHLGLWLFPCHPVCNCQSDWSVRRLCDGS